MKPDTDAVHERLLRPVPICRVEQGTRNIRSSQTFIQASKLDAMGAPDGARAQIAVVIVTDSVLGIVVAVVAIQTRLRITKFQNKWCQYLDQLR